MTTPRRNSFPNAAPEIKGHIVDSVAAGEYAGVSRWTIARWGKKGLIPVIEYEDFGEARYDLRDIAAYIARSTKRRRSN